MGMYALTEKAAFSPGLFPSFPKSLRLPSAIPTAPLAVGAVAGAVAGSDRGAAERGGAVQGADGPALGGRARPTAGSFPGKAAAWFGRCSSPNCLSSFSAVRWGHGWAVACVPLLKDA